MQWDADVIVVGSGFGGAVNACRLAEAGYRVLVLERGREWSAETYPRGPGDHWFYLHSAPQLLNGWMDFRYFGNMSVAMAAGVGGGSLIYANVSIVPPASVFAAHWPAAISHEQMQPYYARVGKMLTPTEIPAGQEPRRYFALQKGAIAVGAASRFQKVPLAITFAEGTPPGVADKQALKKNRWGANQGLCNHCGFCCSGCTVHAKNTLDLNYLQQARNHGALIRALHVVHDISPLHDEAKQISGWQIEGWDVANGEKTPFIFRAPKVVLAAGSLGSSEILLRARDVKKSLPLLSDQLGKGWSSNGDFITFSTHKADMHLTHGPSITSAIDYLDGGLEGQKVFIEDGALGDVPRAFQLRLLRSMRHWFKPGFWKALIHRLQIKVAHSETAKHLVTWFAQAVDASNGEMRMHRPWWAPWAEKTLHIDWDPSASVATFTAIDKLHRQLAMANDAEKFYTPPTWSWLHDLVTPHPLGGCRMADSPEQGVVNAYGEVFHYPGLYVADGAIIPYAIGLNPSRTIAALAEMIAEHIVTTDRERA